jgi:hypothetical protein
VIWDWFLNMDWSGDINMNMVWYFDFFDDGDFDFSDDFIWD